MTIDCDKISNENRQRVLDLLEEMKRKELESKYHLWQGSDGRWFVHLTDGKKRFLRRAKSKADLLKVVADWEENHSYNPTLEEYYSRWNEERLSLNQIRESSALRYRDLYKQKLTPIGNIRMRQLTADKIAEFLEELAASLDSYRIWLSVKNTLFMVLNEARRDQLIAFSMDDVRDRIRVTARQFDRKIKPDNKEVYTSDEVKRLIDLFLSEPDDIHMGLLLMIVTGIRVGELATLKPTDIHEDSIVIQRTEIRYVGEDGEAHFKVGGVPKTKNSYREIIVPRQYKWLLQRLRLRTTEWCFYTINGKRASADSFRVRLRRACRLLKIAYRPPHKIRKTYATALLDDGIDSRFVAEQMGHSSAVITEMYYHRDRRSEKDKERLISSVPDFSYREPEGTTATAQ